MKNKIFQNVLIIAAMMSISGMLSSCDKKESVDKKSPTITQGIYGTVIERYGNWMPEIDPKDTTRGERPMATEVYVYELTKTSDFEARYQSLTYFPIDYMPKPLVAKTTSDKNGFYEVQLQPGTYSLFIKVNDMLYADLFGQDREICPVSVTAGSVIKWDLIWDHAVY